MKMENTLRLAVAASATLLVSQMTLAQGVGNLASLPTVFTGPNPPVGWTVTDAAGGPVPVVRDPNGPAWGKSFTGPNGGAFTYPPTSPTNPPLNVQEFLTVSGNLPWTDWHEDVIGIDALSGASDPGWSWINPTILVNGVPPTNLTITGAGTNSLSFFFDPVAPGSSVIIRKQLVYNGVPGAAFVGTLAVHEYPTPEPATLALFGAGSLMALRRRRPKAS